MLTHPNIKIPERGNIYSINEGNSIYWLECVNEYIKSIKNPKEGKPYSLRYTGSMVADVHRTILYGGIFLYPIDKKLPNGKLRLIYELNPMAYVIECAGGKAINQNETILDINPTELH